MSHEETTESRSTVPTDSNQSSDVGYSHNPSPSISMKEMKNKLVEGLDWLVDEPSPPPEIGDKVFVYGTLMTGQGNNIILRSSPSLGSATTVDKWVLPYANFVPFLLPIKGEGHKVKGELFTPESLKVWGALDRLEGHPVAYRRGRIKVMCNGKEEEAWCYFYQAYPSELAGMVQCGLVNEFKPFDR